MTTTAVESGYAVTITFNPPDRVPRWQPIFGGLLAIPHFIVLYVLGLVSGVCLVIAWFCGVITGRVPAGLIGLITGVIRYRLRLLTYVLFMRGAYPGFGLETDRTDPRTDPMVAIDFALAEKRSRLTIFFRGLLVIPHLIVLMFVGVGVYVCLIIAWFATIILGHWPRGLQDFVLGALRWSTRVEAYYQLVTDDYPPFSMH